MGFKEIEREGSMKKVEMSETASNLLVVSSVTVAVTPFVLGDSLMLVFNCIMREGMVIFDQISNYLLWLVS
jgi:hypothetical protein